VSRDQLEMLRIAYEAGLARVQRDAVEAPATVTRGRFGEWALHWA